MNPSLLTRSASACVALLASVRSLFLPRSAPRKLPSIDHSLAIAPASEFVYVPARDGHMPDKRISNTASTPILLKKNVDAAVRDAVASTVREANFGVPRAARLVLGARIEALFTHDAHSPAVWTLTMRYTLTNAATREAIYASTKTVHTHQPKFSSSALALDDIVSLSVGALLADPALRRAVDG